LKYCKLFVKKLIPNQPPENDYGNREYKYKIDDHDIDKLATQLKYRLTERAGKALYFLGVFDNGQTVGIDSLQSQ
jgi:GTPase